jgi:hypothetical protein
MASSEDHLQSLVSDLADHIRDEVRRALDSLVTKTRTMAEAEREEAAKRARTDAESAAATLVSNTIAAERASAEERLAKLSNDARARERQSMLASAERLLTAVRAIDGAGSLSEALDALTTAAAAEAGRAALLVRRGNSLKGWAHAGFATEMPDAKSIDLPLESAGVLADALESGERRSTAGGDVAEHAQVPAPFTPPSSERVGLALPVTVDGQAVAVLYVDDASDEEAEVPSAWPEHVEVLARHTGRALEGLTARQTGKNAAAIASDRSHPDAEGARRFARLLISEIKLYHETQVNEGRRARDLLQRLEPHIQRARSLYEERVPPDVRGRADYFDEELVRTLAGGDPVLLGRAS